MLHRLLCVLALFSVLSLPSAASGQGASEIDLSSAAPLSAGSMQFRMLDLKTVPDLAERGYTHVILADGLIDGGSADRFINFVRSNRFIQENMPGLGIPAFDKRVLVQLRSPGGDVAQSLGIGKIIRMLRMDTEVQQGCFSACVFIFAGGQGRYYQTGQLGVHRLSRDAGELGLNETYTAAAAIAEYVNAMGVGFEFLALMGSSAPEAINVLSVAQAASLGLSNQGLVAHPPFWSGSSNEFVVQNESPQGNLEISVFCKSGSERLTIDLYMPHQSDTISREGPKRSYYLSFYDPIDSQEPIRPTALGQRADIRAVSLGAFRRKDVSEGDERGSVHRFLLNNKKLSSALMDHRDLFIFSAETDLSKIKVLYRGRVGVASSWARDWQISQCMGFK